MKNKKIVFAVCFAAIVVIILVLALFNKTYEVTFISDDEVLEVVKVKKNMLVDRPKNPTKDGYSFVRWELDGEKYNFGSKVTKNITLIAKWKQITTSNDNDVVKEDIVVNNITLSTTVLNLKVGESDIVQIISPVSFNSVNWYSSNPNIAVVDNNGKVTGVKAGQAIISVNIDGQIMSIIVNVTEEIKEISYKIEYREAQNSALNQYYFYIIDSENNYVDGTIEFTTIGGDTIEIKVSKNGSEPYIKSLINLDTVKIKSIS